jgi:hypothetical protein
MKSLSQVLENSPNLSPEKTISTSLIRQHGLTAADGTTSITPSTLDSLRFLAETTKRGDLLSDESLKELLLQHFGSRLAITEVVDHRYHGPNGYEPTRLGFRIVLDGLADDEMKFYDALEFFNRPATAEFIAGQIARLRVSMPRRAEENMDIELLVDVMVDDCREYPADIIAHVAKQWRLENRFFPIPKDFRAKLEQSMAFRRAIWNCFQEKRDPMLAAKSEAKRLAADHRLGMHYRELAKKEWLRCHWDWYVGDAEHMVRLSREQNRTQQTDEWKVEYERRMAEREAVVS